MFWTLATRKRTNPKLEFVPKRFQRVVIDTVLDAIRRGYDLSIEKSRDMGITWIVLCVFVYLWLWDDHCDLLVMSKGEKAVDNRGDMNSLFERIRWQLRMIDQTMPGIVPPKWDKFSSEGKIINPVNGSSIVGVPVTDSVSKQGRYMAGFFDEFPTLNPNMQEAVMSATLGAMPCRLFCGTPEGLAMLFASMNLALRKTEGARIDFFKPSRKGAE